MSESMSKGEFLSIAVVAMLLLSGAARSDDAGSGAAVCQTEDCWRMSTTLHASLNTSADPCDNFEEFLCGGFRSSHQFTGLPGLLSGKAYVDYMQQSGTAYSERVTEQLVTDECRDSEDGDCGPSARRPASAKLRAYERLAFGALRDCARIEAGGNRTLQELVRLNLFEVMEEAIDLGMAGVMDSRGRPLRLESLMPAQSAKSLHSPLTIVPGVVHRQGGPALLLVAMEPFPGLHLVPSLLSHFPLQMSRLLRQLRMPLPRGLAGLMRYALASVQLWDYSCNRTATRVINATSSKRPVQTVGDAKRLLRLANLTFDLDEFLRLSVEPHLAVNDTTGLLLSDPSMFLFTVCLLDQCAKRRPDLIKVLVIRQIAMLAVEVLGISNDARCIEELFGVGSESDGEQSSEASEYVGAFRPLLHGRYARVHANPAVEAEVRSLFAQLKATYSTVLTAVAWIPSRVKPALAHRVDATELRFQREAVSEANLLRHYQTVLDGMPARGCTLSVSPACLLVRARALQMSLALRQIHASLDNSSPHYDQLLHAVFLTPAFSDPPHYRPGQPLAVRLGLLGFVMAHELTHGLLAETDPASVLRKQAPHQSLVDQLPGSWPEEFARRFRSREGCLRDRLATEQGLNKTSVMEDIGDGVGLSVAHRVLAQSGDTGRLPGYMARFTPAQLFYIASMRTFCSKASPRFWPSFLRVSATLSHTPGRMRIQSMLAGDANFAGAFGCPDRVRRRQRKPGGETTGLQSERMCEFW